MSKLCKTSKDQMWKIQSVKLFDKFLWIINKILCKNEENFCNYKKLQEIFDNPYAKVKITAKYAHKELVCYVRGGVQKGGFWQKLGNRNFWQARVKGIWQNFYLGEFWQK